VSGIAVDLQGGTLVPTRVLESLGARLDVPGVPGLRVSADVRNLSDVRTADYAGVLGPTRLPIGDVFAFPLPGRNVLVTASHTFGPREVTEPAYVGANSLR
jgi:hypothetical protein